MYVAVGEPVAGTASVYVDALPAVGHVVIGQIAEHVVEPVTTEDDGLLQCPFCMHRPMDMHGCIVLELQTGAGKQT